MQPVFVKLEEFPHRRRHYHDAAENGGEHPRQIGVLDRPKIHYRNGSARQQRGNFRCVEESFIQPRSFVVPVFLRLKPALQIFE